MPTRRNATTEPRGNAASERPTHAAGAAEATASIDRLAFDAAFAELERTVAELETGGLPLERTIELYERAAALQAHCERLLADAELRFRRLVERAGGGVEAIEGAPDEDDL